MSLTRREVLSGAVAVSSLATAGRFIKAEAAENAGAYAPVFAALDSYVERFLREANAPGLTLVLADREGVQRVVTYGFGDKDLRTPVGPNELFQIGSISKSFTAISLLQLHTEGRLDFHKPIQHYLPWLRIQSEYPPITVHHLLTHSSGLPAYSDLISTDPSYAHRAAYAPGTQYFYNNMAYSALGYLAWTLDGRQLPQLLRERVLSPLGMKHSEPAIDFDMRDRLVKSYTTFQSDRPQPRAARLCEAAPLIYTSAAGCVAATAHNMGLYIQMLANRGRMAGGRLLSPEAFDLFATGHIAAPDFGATARYGYGMAVDQLDGNTMLFHTGGMLSFISSLMVDMDTGVGAFAAVNALDKTVTPIVRYANQLMRAHRERRSAPSVPPLAVPAWRVENAADYAGIYRQNNGRSLEVLADGERLFLRHKAKLVPLETRGGRDTFLALHPDF
ncbi:serine hydrolase domain-containing protein, partial [Steroidobacter sp.]|uniref:serine hydrolase domain-containing protein n=1 Tax=Steroidobacter sp. TaxID=1978227 RepID=UPI001A63C716